MSDTWVLWTRVDVSQGYIKVGIEKRYQQYSYTQSCYVTTSKSIVAGAVRPFQAGSPAGEVVACSEYWAVR